MIENGMVTSGAAEMARADRYSGGEIEAAYIQLRDEFARAMFGGAKATISTPGWSRPSAPIVEVVNDEFAGTSGNDNLRELLAIVGDLAQGKGDAARALAWIERQAEAHAAFHAEDLARELAGGGW